MEDGIGAEGWMGDGVCCFSYRGYLLYIPFSRFILFFFQNFFYINIGIFLAFDHHFIASPPPPIQSP
jgi:hypothetical protein